MSRRKRKQRPVERRQRRDGDDDDDDDGDEEPDDGESTEDRPRRRPRKDSRRASRFIDGESGDGDDDDRKDAEDDVDLHDAEYANDDLKQEILQAALNNGLNMGASVSNDERVGLEHRSWDWESNYRQGEYCFLCRYAEMTSQSGQENDYCSKLQEIFDRDYGKMADRGVCVLVKEVYDKQLKEYVPNQEEWRLESIMYHFAVDAPSETVMSATSKRYIHRIRHELAKEMKLKSRKSGLERLNLETVKLFLALDKSFHGHIKKHG